MGVRGREIYIYLYLQREIEEREWKLAHDDVSYWTLLGIAAHPDESEHLSDVIWNEVNSSEPSIHHMMCSFLLKR